MTRSKEKDSLVKKAEEAKNLYWVKPADECRYPQKINDLTSPTGYTFIRCGAKVWGKCSYCASLYQHDQRRIIGSGALKDLVGKEPLRSYDFYAVTLSAPSFGKVHLVSTERGMVKCSCGDYHLENDPLRGTPVNPYYYHYRNQVEWNSHVNELLRDSMKYCRDKLPGVEYVAMREWQARGSIHIHMLVRVPKDTNHKRSKVMRELKRIKTYKYRGFSWGRQIYIQDVNYHNMNTVIFYISKSFGKSPRQQSMNYGILSDELIAHYEKLDKHSRRVTCSKGAKCLLVECEGRAHESFGFNGHIITFSKHWYLTPEKTTLKSLREERRAWVDNNVKKEDRIYDDRLEKIFLRNEQAFNEALPVLEGGFNERRAQELFETMGIH